MQQQPTTDLRVKFRPLSIEKIREMGCRSMMCEQCNREHWFLPEENGMMWCRLSKPILEPVNLGISYYPHIRIRMEARDAALEKEITDYVLANSKKRPRIVETPRKKRTVYQPDLQ